MYYACNEHVELAIDHIVDEEETFPNLERIEDKQQCSFCEEVAEYKVSHEH